MLYISQFVKVRFRLTNKMFNYESEGQGFESLKTRKNGKVKIVDITTVVALF